MTTVLASNFCLRHLWSCHSLAIGLVKLSAFGASYAAFARNKGAATLGLDNSHAAASGNIHGALYMLVGMGFLLLNDVMVKLVGARLPVSEMMFIRGAMASAMLFGICAALGVVSKLHQVFHPKVLGRSTAELAGAFLFLSALVHMPIANVNTIMQSVPLTMTVAAAFLLKEQVGARRWTATLTGFLGILLIVKPSSSGFDIFSLYALGAVLFVTLRELLTRAAHVQIPSIVMSLATALALTVGGGLLLLRDTWVPPTGHEMLLLLLAAICQVVAYQGTIMAMRVGELGFVAPFRYSIIIWSLVAGYLVWDNIPDTWSLLGILLVAGMGLYTFHRERVRKVQIRPNKPVTPR